MPAKKNPTLRTASLVIGHVDLFLEDELDEMFEGRQPQPGDVLLLDADGPKALAARLAQGGSPYSHVGLVIGADLYIDAILKEGVRVRRISDIPSRKNRYALKRCKVARNREVIAKVPPVWPSALDYYERPYKLRSVFMKPGGPHLEEDPVICSKLVASIMTDIGFEFSFPVQKTMPKHLAIMCNHGDWVQFPVEEYDIFRDLGSVGNSRKQETQYWLNLLEPLHRVNRKFKAALNKMAKRWK